MYLDGSGGHVEDKYDLSILLLINCVKDFNANEFLKLSIYFSKRRYFSSFIY